MNRKEKKIYNELFEKYKPTVQKLSTEEMNKDKDVMLFAIQSGLSWGEPIEIAYVSKSPRIIYGGRDVGGVEHYRHSLCF